MSRRYGPDDTRTAAEKRADTEKRYTAILEVLGKARENYRIRSEYLTPNEIGGSIAVMDGITVKRSHGNNGAYLGPGSSISPTLRALEKRGWVCWGTRPDGLSGTAYAITDAGVTELARRKEQS